MHARVQNVFTHGNFGILESPVGGVFIAHVPGENVVVMATLTLSGFILANQVFTDDRRVRVHRLVRIDQRGQLFVFDFHQFGAVSGDVAVVGDDHCDFLHLETDFFVGQHRLSIAGEGRHPV